MNVQQKVKPRPLVVAALVYRHSSPSYECLVMQLQSGPWTLPNVVGEGVSTMAYLPQLRSHLAKLGVLTKKFEFFSDSLGPFDLECTTGATYAARHIADTIVPGGEYAGYRWVKPADWASMECFATVREALTTFVGPIAAAG